MKRYLSQAGKALALSLIAATVASAAPLAEGGAKFLGNITTRGAVRSDMGTYWNQITAENECKWGSINTAEDKYNWSGCDAAYNWAKNNGYHFKFHALVWGSQYPNWITSLSAERTKEVIEKWMKAVSDHYKQDIEMIDVVNEAIWGGQDYHSGYTKTKIIEALGGDPIEGGKHTYKFVAEAFKMARKYFPNSVLIYNDYNTIQWNIDEGINLVNQIKKQGAPVDAYGQQAHDITGLGKSQFESALKKIHDAVQIPLFISEYDVGEANDEKQKTDYANHIPFLWETEWIAGITLWGYINGATWIDNTGLLRETNGGTTDRASMTWLKQYFAQNLDKGQNTTGLCGSTPVEPEPQTPFKGSALAIPGKIEIEDFDVPGKGKNEDGSSNISYTDGDSENHGDSDYRKDTGVDLYEKATGIAAGYNQDGDWLEYTVDVAEAGEYTVYVSAATPSTGTGFSLMLDPGTSGEKALCSTVEVLPSRSGDSEDYSDFQKVSTKVTLPAGKHIIRFTVDKGYFDVDYMTFVKGDGEDPEPIEVPKSISQTKFEQPTLEDYYVIDPQGVRMGTLSAYGFSGAAEILKGSNVVKSSGVYYLRSRTTGKIQKVRIVR